MLEWIRYNLENKQKLQRLQNRDIRIITHSSNSLNIEAEQSRLQLILLAEGRLAQLILFCNRTRQSLQTDQFRNLNICLYSLLWYGVISQ